MAPADINFKNGGPADVFQIYPNAIHFNPLQFCPSMSLLGFPVFCLSSSIVLSRYFDILVACVAGVEGEGKEKKQRAKLSSQFSRGRLTLPRRLIF